MTQNSSDSHTKRSIRSFVKRSGRLTKSQQFALQNYWSLYGIGFEPDQALDLNDLFPGLECTKLEIGFGNGDTLVNMASKDPQCGYIGIEVHEPGVGRCLQQIHQLGLSNLRLISHDAVEVLQAMIAASSLDAVFLFFPDPWHKKKHHKRRIVNQSFRDSMVRILKPGAVLHMATDWMDYAQHMAEEMLADDRFENRGDAQGFCAKPEYRPETKFERRGLRLGHEVRDLVFVKR